MQTTQLQLYHIKMLKKTMLFLLTITDILAIILSRWEGKGETPKDN